MTTPPVFGRRHMPLGIPELTDADRILNGGTIHKNHNNHSLSEMP